MAALSFSIKSLILLLCTAIAVCFDQDAAVLKTNEDFVQNAPDAQRFLHHVAKRHAPDPEDSQQERSAPMKALLETGKLLRTAAMLPAETLQVLRMVTVPLLNTTLAFPANMLEGAASMSLGSRSAPVEGHAKAASNDIWKYLAPWKLIPRHHLLLRKDFSFGPFSFKKVLEFGTALKNVVTTPAPEVSVVSEKPTAPVAVVPGPAPVPVVLGPTPAPVVIVPATEAPPPPPPVVPTTEAPPPPVVVVPVTVTPPPPVVVAEVPPPPPVTEVPPPPPAPVVPLTTPAPPAALVPVAPSPVVVVAPQPTHESTNQIAIVQNSPGAVAAAVSAIPEPTPAPVVLVATAPAPQTPVIVAEAAPPTPVVLIPVTPPPAVPLTTPPPPVSIAPVAPNPVVVVAPQPPIDSTNQIAIVQNSPGAVEAAVSLAPKPTPAPVVVIPATQVPPPPVIVAEAVPPTPAAVVPVTTPPPPVSVIPITTPPPVPVVPAAPNPVVVVAPKPPIDSTNQIAIVQNSPGPVAAAAGISENTI